jgi:hypothetical protein
MNMNTDPEWLKKMADKCVYCPATATHTNSVVDLDGCATHGVTAYKRVLICEAHAREASRHNTSRVEPIPSSGPSGTPFVWEDH